MARKAQSLNDKQRRFVDRYVVHLNSRMAAQEAGYSPSGRADASADRLMANPLVRAAIEERLRRARDKSDLDEAYVITRLQKIAERCMTAEPVLMDGEPTGEYRFDSGGANRSLELLGKHLGMFADRLLVDDLRGKSDDELEAERARLQAR